MRNIEMWSQNIDRCFNIPLVRMIEDHLQTVVFLRPYIGDVMDRGELDDGHIDN